MVHLKALRFGAPRQPEEAGGAPELGCFHVDEQASDEETGLLEDPAPAGPEGEEPEGIVAISMALSAEVIAELPACAVIKGVDIVECQRCDRPTVRSRLHGQGECSPRSAELSVCKSCGQEDVMWFGVPGSGASN